MKNKFFVFIVIIFIFTAGFYFHKTGNNIERNFSVPETKKNIKSPSYVPVLEYHHLQKEGTFDKKLGGLIIDPGRFEMQMKYLKSKGYHTITLEELKNFVLYNKSLPPKPMLITFDDGYLSNYVYAYPILKKLKMNAVINIIVSYVPNNYKNQPRCVHVPHFDWKQAKEMSDSGVIEIESHTYNLHNLASNGKAMIPMVSGPIIVNGRLETESQYKERLKRDFVLSSTLIKEHVGKAPIAIAYPFGTGNHISNEIAREAGFEMAFAQEREGVVRCGDDIMSLKRIIINNYFTGSDIINQINKYGR